MNAYDLLERYKAKRNFLKTPEPVETGVASKDALSFVIQKHWATRLHYDFRLELNGTLKSWAVPKGPSFDPKDKRLAVHVEDHPISYASFEGTIPAKLYGAGKVIVWDKGFWVPVGNPEEGYKEGNLKFQLQGHKLQGNWALVRMKGKSDKQEPWLLIKEKDEFAKAAQDYSVVDELPESVLSLKSSKAPIVKTSSVKATSNDSAKQKSTKKNAEAESVSKEKKPSDDTSESTGLSENLLLKAGAIKAALPAKLAPQLAVLTDSPPKNNDEWIYEIKFDGYRLLTRIQGNDIKLFSRNGNDWTSKLKNLHKEISKLKLPTGWYDGEIVVLDENDIPDFGLLQRVIDTENSNKIILYLFDLPYFDGMDLGYVPLMMRKALLKHIVGKKISDAVRLSEVFETSAKNLIASVCKLGLEGIIAKHRHSHYLPRRTSSWVKIKCSYRQEFVIAGYTEPKGTRKEFGALLLGVHNEHGELTYAGSVGTGFDQKALTDIKSKLDALAAKTCPFSKTPKILMGKPHWVKPKLLAEVSYREWTGEGRLRHPVFHGLRTDKPADQITRETIKPMASIDSSEDITPSTLSSHLRVTHPDRLIDTGITKIDLVKYYDLVKHLMIEHLAHRPVALLRAPQGIQGELFFQKHAEVEKLEGVIQVNIDKEHEPFLEVVSEQGLLTSAQWNVIEFHTGNNFNNHPNQPDRMVFDLDPGEGVQWQQVQEAAQMVQAFLAEIRLPAFLKTSGGKGLHIVVPIKMKYNWEQVKSLSEAIVSHIAKIIPTRFVAKSGPKNRIGKIYIDYLRNGEGATTVCAWSARARPGLGVSVPISWNELASIDGGNHWNIKTIHARLENGNKPWKEYNHAAVDITSAIKLFK
ncbi:MAG TPA: DNA ligase D [Methylotenera sp.]|nr:DNA ligase D [Methylotenera sp.]